MCIRKLWMNVQDRYAVGVTFHERPGTLPPQPYGQVLLPNGSMYTQTGARTTGKVPSTFLGRTNENHYEPICVAWTAPHGDSGRARAAWMQDCGSLFFSAGSLEIPVVAKINDVGDGVGSVELVPVEWRKLELD